jgi:hypothetical protein
MLALNAACDVWYNSDRSPTKRSCCGLSWQPSGTLLATAHCNLGPSATKGDQLQSFIWDARTHVKFAMLLAISRSLGVGIVVLAHQTAVGTLQSPSESCYHDHPCAA